MYHLYSVQQSPRLLLRQSVYWGVVILTGTIIPISIYQLHSIPATIGANIDQLLSYNPEYRELIVIDGRDVYLRGKIEPDPEVEIIIDQIAQIPLVRRVTNLLELENKPTPHLRLQGTPDLMLLSGELPGNSLERVIDAVTNSFPARRIGDQLRIDDRLGQPWWLDGLAQGLLPLQQLSQFELHAWRKQLQLTGLVDDPNQARQIGAALLSSFRRQMSLDNRLRQRPNQSQAQLALVADWSGTRLSGKLPHEDDINRLTQVVQQAFGRRQIKIDLQSVSDLQAPWLVDLVELLPYLSVVRSLRLQNDGAGLSLWGNVDNQDQLGSLIEQRGRLHRAELFNFQIKVESTTQPATLALFADRRNIYLDGTVPTLARKKQIESGIADLLEQQAVISRIKVKPGVASNNWLQVWQPLMQALPRGIAGLSIDDKKILITGNVDNIERLERINSLITQLLPKIKLYNWVTVRP